MSTDPSTPGSSANEAGPPGDVSVRHPIFSRFFVALSKLMERELGERRGLLLEGLSGRVLEVGAGNGMNFGHYPPAVEEVVAIEPEAHLRRKATVAAARAAAPVTVREGVADRLPGPDSRFDAVVLSLVLCSVPDPARALAEAARVLRPGGELRFMEHVLAESPRVARAQRWLDRTGTWPRLAGGCHCARETRAAIERAGFGVESCKPFDLGPRFSPTRPHVLGIARSAGGG
ncbi:MAG: class I SAM-dependent methyltransferase [Thermoleophilaceae bacterium]|nr:class I SAM-dependent methyltransferase [Thermoleophilaceae bacterium]